MCTYVPSYWRRDLIFRYAPIADKIPRDRFLDLWRFLHFADNSTAITNRTDPRFDRLWKVRTILDLIQEQCIASYISNCHQSIDEAIIKFNSVGLATPSMCCTYNTCTTHAIVAALPVQEPALLH